MSERRARSEIRILENRKMNPVAKLLCSIGLADALVTTSLIAANVVSTDKGMTVGYISSLALVGGGIVLDELRPRTDPNFVMPEKVANANDAAAKTTTETTDPTQLINQNQYPSLFMESLDLVDERVELTPAPLDTGQQG